MTLNLNLYHVLALAPIVYYLGEFLVQRIDMLRRYCIPSPVVGGLVFALLKWFLHSTGLMSVTMDAALQTPLMYAFFCSIGFSARFKLLKSGGMILVILSVLVAVICIAQNFIGATLADLLGFHPLLGVALGSVPLVGGHGTAAAFGGIIEEMGAPNAAMAAIAAATFGLVVGAIIGGPLARKRIESRKLAVAHGDDYNYGPDSETRKENIPSSVAKRILNKKHLILAAFLLCLAVGLGNVISYIISKTGMVFSAAVGSLLAGLLIRSICDYRNVELPDEELNICGDFALYAYLAMAMLSLRLWELADLALPMIVILGVQTIFIALFVYYVVFNFTGRDYESSVMATGVTGFGLGATVTAVANMEATRRVYGPAPKAFLVIPILGSFIADIINSSVITVFLSIYK